MYLPPLGHRLRDRLKPDFLATFSGPMVGRRLFQLLGAGGAPRRLPPNGRRCPPSTFRSTDAKRPSPFGKGFALAMRFFCAPLRLAVDAFFTPLR